VTVKVQGRVVAAPVLTWWSSARCAPGRCTRSTGLAAGGEFTARAQPAVPATVEEGGPHDREQFSENEPRSLRTYATLPALVALQRKDAVRLLNVWIRLCTLLVDHVR